MAFHFQADLQTPSYSHIYFNAIKYFYIKHGRSSVQNLKKRSVRMETVLMTKLVSIPCMECHEKLRWVYAFITQFYWSSSHILTEWLWHLSEPSIVDHNSKTIWIDDQWSSFWSKNEIFYRKWNKNKTEPDTTDNNCVLCRLI